MEFEVKERNCNTRVGALHLEGHIVETPAILWISTPHFQPPPFASLLLTRGEKHPDIPTIKDQGSPCFPDIPKKSVAVTIPPALIYPSSFPDTLHSYAAQWNDEQESDCCIVHDKALSKVNLDAQIYILANSPKLLASPQRFISTIISLREKIGDHKLIYTPGLGEPSHLAILSYCTIDLFDSAPLLYKALEHRYLTSDGETDIPTDLPCACPACSTPTSFTVQDLITHNYYAAQTELKTIRHHIKTGDLRELVEARASRPPAAALLLFLDREYYPFQEKRFSAIGKKIVASSHFLDRPDVRRFRERVQERFHKPQSTRVLVLLPCSARKPYSFSKSHQLFTRILSQCGNPSVVHELILTSPLGLVPRELEMVYPAGHYDIPVTGYWTREEQAMLTESLRTYLEHNKYDCIIAHLPREITEFLSLDALYTCVNHPTSDSSLHKLLVTLKKATSGYQHLGYQERLLENMGCLAAFQFTPQGSTYLLEGCHIKGRYPYYKIFWKDQQIGMLVKERGVLSLTLTGAQRLVQGGRYRVDIDNFMPHGSIFAKGITDADALIRCGDEVIVTYGDDVRAVGVAAMNAHEMIQSDSGEAVKVRHYKKA